MKTRILLLTAISAFFMQCTQHQTVEKPPLAPEKPVTDTYFGTSLTDDYQYLENTEDTTVLAWLKAQGDYAKTVLGSIDARQELLDKMYDFDSRRTVRVTNLSITDNDRYFYLKTTPDDDTGKLFFREGLGGSETLLFDPETFGNDSTVKYVINNILPTYDGEYLAFGVTPNGKELATLMVMKVDDRELLPDRVEQVLGITSWLPGKNSFLYIRTGSDNVSDFSFYTEAKTCLHRINTDASTDTDFFSKEQYPALGLGQMDIPVAAYDRDCDKVYALAANVDNRAQVFFAPGDQLDNDQIDWKLLFGREDEIYNWATNQKDLFLYSPKDAPNFKLLRVSLDQPEISEAETFIPEDPGQKLSGFTLTKDGVYYTMKLNGVQEKLYFKPYDGESRELTLPFVAGTVMVRSKGVEFSEVWVTLAGWTSNSQRFRYDLADDAFVLENLSVIPEYPEYKDLVVEEVMVKSHDGVEVPLSIIYKNGLKKDGSQRLLLFGYGSYGISMDPGFGPNTLLWCLEDGIFAIAHVRGGGELGEQWHKAGFKTTKPNTWKDFIACAEYMVDQQYTTPEKIAIYGGSAGGILIGRAMTERPDLFAAAIPSVGVMNAVRTELEPGGPANIPEFGTVKDSVEFLALLEMDAYHHLKEGVKYPPALITAGMNDPRVAVWNPGKFAARLQAINQDNNPVIFRVDYEAGHGLDNTKSRNFEELADILSFALWNTGSEKYKPKAY
ncbi:prolyl oligopeptidase family serine peptidase [Maribellus sp. CM-23]|uniref:prolyl oligopeptidase family serine peptidase n=1 Tax=Maribellus sp. CM-23 TaxID=2781026 RepID=UPI001F2AB7FE|nr:prolyl oligopeptidase family serine peptidase [Maribellus sp. CM-23]